MTQPRAKLPWWITVMGMIAALMLALGLYSSYADGGQIHPLLRDRNVVMGVLVTGVLLIVVEIVCIVRIARAAGRSSADSA